MTRPAESGRKNSVMVRLTDSGLAYIDSQRGDQSRAEFIRQVLVEHSGARPKPQPLDIASAKTVGEVVVAALEAEGLAVARKKGGR